MTASLLYSMLKSKTKHPLHAAVRLRREDVVFLYLIEHSQEVSNAFRLIVSFCARYFLFVTLLPQLSAFWAMQVRVTEYRQQNMDCRSHNQNFMLKAWCHKSWILHSVPLNLCSTLGSSSISFQYVWGKSSHVKTDIVFKFINISYRTFDCIP